MLILQCDGERVIFLKFMGSVLIIHPSGKGRLLYAILQNAGGLRGTHPLPRNEKERTQGAGSELGPQLGYREEAGEGVPLGTARWALQPWPGPFTELGSSSGSETSSLCELDKALSS